MRDSMTDALNEVKYAMQQADDKWGIQRHDLPVWMTILGEEFGEVATSYGDLCRAVLTTRWALMQMNGAAPPKESFDTLMEALRHTRLEAAQTAAVASMMIEHIREVEHVLQEHERSPISLTNAFESLDSVLPFTQATHWKKNP